jgi:hypothetical protein
MNGFGLDSNIVSFYVKGSEIVRQNLDHLDSIDKHQNRIEKRRGT